MTVLYGEKYLTGAYRMVYRVKEDDYYYFLEKYVGDIFSIMYRGEMIIVKKGELSDFQRKLFLRRRFTKI